MLLAAINSDGDGSVMVIIKLRPSLTRMQMSIMLTTMLTTIVMTTMVLMALGLITTVTMMPGLSVTQTDTVKATQMLMIHEVDKVQRRQCCC